MMSHFIFTVLALSGVLFAGEQSPIPANDIILFKNGATIPANPINIDQQPANGAITLTFQSTYFNQPLPVVASDLKEIICPSHKKQMEGPCVVWFATGETLSGQFESLNTDYINLTASWGEHLSIPLRSLRSIVFNQQGQLIYAGTENPSGWTGIQGSYPANSQAWSTFRGSFLSTPPGGTISYPMALSDSIHVSLSLQGRPYIRFLMHLWKDDSSTANACVDFHFLHDIFQLTEIVDDMADTLANDPTPQTDSVSQESEVQSQSTRIDLFANRQQGLYYVYIDGQLAKQCTREVAPDRPPTSQAQPQFGSGFSLESFDSILLISHLRVTQWNGQFPGKQLLEPAKQLPPSRQQSFDSPIVQLTNGDLLRGSVSSPDAANFHIQSHLYKLVLPQRKISQISLVSAEADIASPDATLAQFYLTDGSILIGTPLSLNENTWQISSYSLGLVHIHDTMISRIIFRAPSPPVSQS